MDNETETRQDLHPESGKEELSKGILISEIKLPLAEKRTSLSVMRTGITVFTLAEFVD